jgi:hypothetical protein
MKPQGAALLSLKVFTPLETPPDSWGKIMKDFTCTVATATVGKAQAPVGSGRNGRPGHLWSPRNVDNKRATVTQASANVAEAYGMAKSCTAAVGDAWMTVLMRFMKVVKKIKKYTAPTVAVPDELLMGFTGGYGRFSYSEMPATVACVLLTASSASGGRSCATASRPRYADASYLRRICVTICAT